MVQRFRYKYMHGKMQVRRKKGGEEGSVMKAEDIEGYRGKEDIDAILSFIEAEVKTQSLDTVKKFLWVIRMGDTFQMTHPNYQWHIRMAQ